MNVYKHHVNRRNFTAVFDACLSNNTINENEFKSYLGRVVTSLQRFHPGASFMVFNFREGDQISLLSDILIDYDMTVVDYPRNHEGYPLLQLEMINYILRSSESWLSLGQKNVILMHCEKGGWPVLAFMLAGLLLYRKQNNGEQKTLEMVYKMAPKQLFSTLSPLNARASQLRYLQYITGRDLGLDWPPPDAHLVVDCLLLHNLPLFDGGKGCRPVVRVFGLDPSDKSSRDPRLLLSTLMPDEPAWLYPKEECQLVKLQLLCQVQGDVFLECIHLYDDLATEELIFKVMFHTGFIQSNILALNIGDIDVPWNPKYQLPKDFKAEVLFRDINEVPPQITMELGGGVEYRESDNEFFEVEEVFTPVPGSPEKKKIAAEQEDAVLESKNRDYTLRNGAPRWDLESELSDSSAVLKEIAFIERNVDHASENVPDVKDIVVTELEVKERGLSEELQKRADNSVTAAKNVVVDLRNSERALEEELDVSAPTSGTESGLSASKSTVLVNDVPQSEAVETKSDIIVSENVVVTDIGSRKDAPKILSEARDDDGNDIPHSGAEIAEFVTSIPKNIVVDESYHNEVPESQTEKRDLEKELDVTAPTAGEEAKKHMSNNIVVTELEVQERGLSEELQKRADNSVTAAKNVVVDLRNSERALEEELDVSAPTSGTESGVSASKSTVLVNDVPQSEAVETKSDIIVSENVVVTDIGSRKDAPKILSEARDDDGNDIPDSGAEIKEFVTNISKNIVVDESYHNEVPKSQTEKRDLEKEVDVTAPTAGEEAKKHMSNNIVLIDNLYNNEASDIKSEPRALEKEIVVTAEAVGAESGINTSRNLVLVEDPHLKEASETQSEAQAVEKEVCVGVPVSGVESGITVPTNIVLDHKQVSKTQSDAEALEKEVVVIAPISGAASGITIPTNSVLANGTHLKEVSETRSEAPLPKKVMDVVAPTSEAEAGIIMSRNFVLDDDTFRQESPETQFEARALEKEMVFSALVLGAETGIYMSRNNVLADEMYLEEATETRSEAQALEKELVVIAPVSETESGINTSRDVILVDVKHYKEASETKSEAETLEKEIYVTEPTIGADFGFDMSSNHAGFDMSSNHVVVDCIYDTTSTEVRSEAQAPEKEMDASEPVSGEESEIIPSWDDFLVDIMYDKQVPETQSVAQVSEKETDVSAPVSGAESGINTSGNFILVDDMFHKEDLKTQYETDALEKEMVISALVSGAESGLLMSRNNVLDDGVHLKEVSETHSDAQALEKEMIVSAPASGAESGVNMLINMDLVDDMDCNEPSEKQSEKEANDDRNTQYLVAELFTHAFGNTLVDEGNQVQTQEKEADDGRDTHHLGAEFFTHAFGNTLADEGTHIQTQEKEANDGRNTEYMGPEFFSYAFGNTLVDEGNHIQTQEEEIDVSIPSLREEADISTSRSVVQEDDKYHKEAPEIGLNIDISNHQEASKSQIEVKVNDGHDVHASVAESATHELKNVAVDDSNHTYELKNVAVDTNPSKNTTEGDTSIHKAASETQSDINVAKTTTVIVEASAPKNIKVVNDGSQIHQVKVEIQPKSVPSSSRPKQIKRNKWQEIASKTITQQRVVSQWVPRAKPQVPEPAKPKTTAYKWVPKGAAAPTGEK